MGGGRVLLCPSCPRGPSVCSGVYFAKVLSNAKCRDENVGFKDGSDRDFFVYRSFFFVDREYINSIVCIPLTVFNIFNVGVGPSVTKCPSGAFIFFTRFFFCGRR